MESGALQGHQGLREHLQETLGDGYVLERELAAGMGRVFVATDTQLGRQVVVKVLRPEMTEAISVERFRREIQVAARLQQANIVPILSADVRGSLAYYTMPYVDGESLRHRLASGRLPIGEAISILRDVARALAYAHAQGVAHRDIKPENILLSAGTAMVTDFGIAKALSASHTSSTGTLTPHGLSLGTPAYMAPEQAAGDRVDSRSDIYSWGVVAYELLAGVHPYAHRRSGQALIAAHIAETAPPVTSKRVDCPPALSQLISRCMEKDAARRPQSANELAAHLEVGSGVASGIDTIVTPPRPQVAERRFRLTERVCRNLDRATLDARLIGDDLHYLDNQVASDVLVCWIPGAGLDGEDFRDALEALPYRAVALTLYGFERERRNRLALPIESHLVLLREFLVRMTRDAGAAVTIVVGFSAGGDVALRLFDAPSSEPLRIDGVLALSCNLSIDTCFATRLFARMDSDDMLLSNLRQCGAGARTVSEWLNIHAYLVREMQKFHGNMAPLQRFAADIVAPFEEGGDVFVSMFRTAAAHCGVVRCVFEDKPIYSQIVQSLRLRNLDVGLLGDHYREDSLIIEPAIDHFELIAPEHCFHHLDEVVVAARQRLAGSE